MTRKITITVRTDLYESLIKEWKATTYTKSEFIERLLRTGLRGDAK